jgi:hypothetical protein
MDAKRSSKTMRKYSATKVDYESYNLRQNIRWMIQLADRTTKREKVKRQEMLKFSTEIENPLLKHRREEIGMKRERNMKTCEKSKNSKLKSSLAEQRFV